MPATAKKWNPPAATIALYKGYCDKFSGNYRAAWKAIPEPKPSYGVFLKIMERLGYLSPLQMKRRSKNKSNGPSLDASVLASDKSPDDYPIVAQRKPLETVQPFKSAPPVYLNGSPESNRNKKIIAYIQKALLRENMTSDEFRGYVMAVFDCLVE